VTESDAAAALVTRRDRGIPDEPLFDELIHPSTRLTIVALLAASDWAEFAVIRDRLGLSDSALSKQLTTLEDADYLAIDRHTVAGRRRVKVRLTPIGRRAFRRHVSALQTIMLSADIGESVGP
jgi:DNA-binding MarR family transcriptional regulator